MDDPDMEPVLRQNMDYGAFSAIGSFISSCANPLVSAYLATRANNTINHVNNLVASSSPIVDNLTRASASIADTADSVRQIIVPTEADRELTSLEVLNRAVVQAKQNPLAIMASINSIFMYSQSVPQVLNNLTVLIGLLGLEKVVLSKVTNLLFSSISLDQIEQLPRQNVDGGLPNLKSVPGRGFLFIAAAAKAAGFNISSFGDNFLASLPKFVNEGKALETLWTTFEDVAEELGFGFAKRTIVVREMRDELQHIIDRMNTFESIANLAASRFCNDSLYREFTKVLDQLYTFEYKIASRKYQAFISSSMNLEILSLATRARKLRDLLDQVRSTNGTRVCPVGIALYGQSQIGKSHITSKLIKDIKDKCFALYESDPVKYAAFVDAKSWCTWSENSRDEYDQGCDGQEFHVQDDAFKMVDDSDHEKWLNFISPERLGTVQADLASKGKPYNARFCIISCNNFPKQSKVLRNVNALANRFHVFVHCIAERVPPSGAPFDPTFSHLKFHLTSGRDYFEKGTSENCHDTHGRCPGEEATYEQILDDIVAKAVIHNDHYQSALEAFGSAQYNQQAGVTTADITLTNLRTTLHQNMDRGDPDQDLDGDVFFDSDSDSISIPQVPIDQVSLNSEPHSLTSSEARDQNFQAFVAQDINNMGNRNPVVVAGTVYYPTSPHYRIALSLISLRIPRLINTIVRRSLHLPAEQRPTYWQAAIECIPFGGLSEAASLRRDFYEVDEIYPAMLDVTPGLYVWSRLVQEEKDQIMREFRNWPTYSKLREHPFYNALVAQGLERSVSYFTTLHSQTKYPLFGGELGDTHFVQFFAAHDRLTSDSYIDLNPYFEDPFVVQVGGCAQFAWFNKKFYLLDFHNTDINTLRQNYLINTIRSEFWQSWLDKIKTFKDFATECVYHLSETFTNLIISIVAFLQEIGLESIWDWILTIGKKLVCFGIEFSIRYVCYLIAMIIIALICKIASLLYNGVSAVCSTVKDGVTSLIPQKEWFWSDPVPVSYDELKKLTWRDMDSTRMSTFLYADILNTQLPALFHCISADKAMSLGLARQIVMKHPNVKQMLPDTLEVGQAYSTKMKDYTIYHLVTKDKYYQKPKEPDFYQAVISAFKLVKEDGYSDIAFPFLGCGLDGLSPVFSIHCMAYCFKFFDMYGVLYDKYGLLDDDWEADFESSCVDSALVQREFAQLDEDTRKHFQNLEKIENDLPKSETSGEIKRRAPKPIKLRKLVKEEESSGEIKRKAPSPIKLRFDEPEKKEETSGEIKRKTPAPIKLRSEVPTPAPRKQIKEHPETIKPTPNVAAWHELYQNELDDEEAVVLDELKFAEGRRFNRQQVDRSAAVLMSVVLNRILLTGISDDGGQLMGWGYDKCVICPNHFWSSCKVGDTARFYKVQYPSTDTRKPSTSVQPIIVELIYGSKDWDLSIARILPLKHEKVRRYDKYNPTYQVFPTLLDTHLIKEQDLMSPQRTNVGLQYVSSLSLTVLCDIQYDAASEIKYINVDNESVTETFAGFEVISANTSVNLSDSGDCGSPLILMDNRAKRKLLGMHVIGSSCYAFATLVTLERFNALKSKIVTQNQNFSVDSLPSFPKILMSDNTKFDKNDYFLLKEPIGQHLPEGDFEYIGDFVKASHPCDPLGRHDLIKSPFFGAFENKTQPSVLIEKDPRFKNADGIATDAFGNPSLLVNQTKGYGEPAQSVDVDLLDDMVQQLVSYSTEKMDGKPIGSPEDFEDFLDESLNGNIEIEHCVPLELRASSGLPWCFNPNFSKKSHFCKKDPRPDMPDKISLDESKIQPRILKEVLRNKLYQAKSGLRTFSLWKDCLKSELRPHLAIEMGKTRNFSCAPLESVLIMKGLFGRYKAVYTSLGTEMFHGVGCNPMSADWAHFLSKIEKHPHCIDEDFSSYDKRELAQFLEAAFTVMIETIDNVTGDSYRLARYTLADEIIRTICMSFKTVYKKKHGNPSGNPLTTIINGWVNFLYHWYVFRSLFPEKQGLSDFLNHVTFISFGDDVIQSISHDVFDKYNFVSIQSILGSLGQVVTFGDKFGDQTLTCKTASEITFLKRHFVRDGLMVLSPIFTDSIEQVFSWSEINHYDINSWIVCLEEQLLEAVQHGEIYFNTFRNNLSRIVNTRRFRTQHKRLRSRVIETLSTTYKAQYIKLMGRYSVLQRIKFEQI